MSITAEQKAELERRGCRVDVLSKSPFHEGVIVHEMFDLIIRRDGTIGFYSDEDADQWEVVMAAIPVAAILGLSPKGYRLVKEEQVQQWARWLYDWSTRLEEDGYKALSDEAERIADALANSLSRKEGE